MKKSELLLLTATLLGCATSAPTRGASSLRGLEDPDRAYWSSLTPTPDAPSLGDTRAAVTFDHWHLGAEATADLWSALFPVLDAARLSGGPEIAPSLDLALRVLEPDGSPGGVVASDASFVVSARDTATPWEGVLVRSWRALPGGGTPGVSVLLTRHANGPLDAPSVATIWVTSGFAEIAPTTISVRDRFMSSTGLLTAPEPADPREPATPEPFAATLLDTLTSSVWFELSQERYIEPALGRSEPTPSPPSRFATPEVASRDIDQVFSMTAFLPKIRSGRFKL